MRQINRLRVTWSMAYQWFEVQAPDGRVLEVFREGGFAQAAVVGRMEAGEAGVVVG